MFKGIIKLVVIGWLATMIAGAIAAFRVKQRLGPNSDEGADDIAASAIFGPLAYHSTSRQLRGGTLELWYGGGVLDLRDAVLHPDGAVLEVRAIFGGGQIIVPPDWRIVTATKGMGGLQDVRDTSDLPTDAPTLTIVGLLVAGGFQVQSELDQGSQEWLESMDRTVPADAP
jgi:predicted membrane protein